MEEKKRQTRSVNERHRIDKIGVSCGRGCENQEARVFDLHEESSEKEWSNRPESHENAMQKLSRTCASNRH